MSLPTHGLSASLLQACATDLAKVVQKYNPQLQGDLTLELHSSSERGQHEISVQAVTKNGQYHDLVRVILKGTPSDERDLNFRVGLPKVTATEPTH
jgi:hypothetical protein